jgi:RNA polymerase sigma-70 factor (ECF subfamily)
MIDSASDAALAQLVRREAGIIAASLSRRLGDFDLAEEAVQDAIVTALHVWRREGVPPNPAGWLTVAARRNAIDRLRRRATGERAAQALAAEPTPDAAPPDGPADVRLPMLFACCHPSLAPEARLALTLRAVVGLTTPQIAGAFLVPEATLAQRIVRAKRKIVQAGIPLRVPSGSELAERLDDVLTVTYLTYNAGYLAPAQAGAPDLAADAVWLAELLVAQLPDEPEAIGLLALLQLLQSRAAARFDASGGLIPLAAQDRSSWDRGLIQAADGLLFRAASLHRPGRYQLQAALAACHAQARSAGETDWLQILTLYDMLLRFDRSPVVLLNRAIALAEVSGPEEALAEVDRLRDRLRDYHLLHATRAQLLASLGRQDEAREANLQALSLTGNPAERELLLGRIEHLAS